MNNESMQLTQLLNLCQFADSALPIGSFAFSNGLESAIQVGLVHDEASLKEFILVALKQSAYLDGIYLQHAFRLAEQNDIAGLQALNLSYISKRVGKEQQLMSSRIGSKLATLFLKITDCSLLRDFLAALNTASSKESTSDTKKACEVTASHPIVHGIICQALKLSPSQAFAIYQFGTASLILSAAVRLMRIDHYQTQRILFEVNQTCDTDYQATRSQSIEQTVSFAPILDCLMAQHVNAHVRMFMN